MEKTTLIFSDIKQLADFIIRYDVSEAEVDSRELRVTAALTDEDLIVARDIYNAKTPEKKIFESDPCDE